MAEAGSAARALPEGGVAGASPPGERTVFEATRGRKIAFSFIFLLLLPFFASLAPMLALRLRSGLWHDLAGFIVFALAFTILMLLILSELVRSLRMRISLGRTALHLTVPASPGPTPLLRYTSYDIPYGEIAAVETRREIYGGWIAPVLMLGARVITKDGRSIKLGYGNEANIDPAFPYPDIARQIATRAGLTVTDRGNVRRAASSKLLGIKSSDPAGEPIGEAEIAALNRAHRRFMAGLMVGLLVLLGVSIAAEFTTHQPQPRAGAPTTPAAKAPAKK